MSPDWLIPIVAYFLGSIPFGYLIVKASRGADVRASGSGNIGATNVSRAAGKFAGIATLILDAAKGYFAVWLAILWTHGNVSWMMAAAFAAIAGHVFSCWLSFRGGKGVATGLGVFLLISPKAVGIALLIWLFVIAIWRYASLSSIVAAASLPVLVCAFYSPRPVPLMVWLGSSLIAILVIFKHGDNVRRLIAGTESRLFQKL